MKFEEFKEKVEGWAQVRGIYDQSTEAKQVDKFKEELWEYLTSSSIDELKDAIGDMAVCIVNAYYLQKRKGLYIPKNYEVDIKCLCLSVSDGEYISAILALEGISNGLRLDFKDCMQMAWDEIKDRKGMMIDGLFVKWENLTDEQQEELQSRLDAHIEADC